jgi:hypothetical protein
MQTRNKLLRAASMKLAEKLKISEMEAAHQVIAFILSFFL